MTLERGRRAASVDRALDSWRREAVDSRATITRLEGRIAQLEAELAQLEAELLKIQLGLLAMVERIAKPDERKQP